MQYTDDPLADFDAWDLEQSRKLKKLPKCHFCHEPIQQEDAVFIFGKWICDDCLDDERVLIEE